MKGADRPSGRDGRGFAPGLAEGIAALLAVVAFASSLGGDFVWDDRILILEGGLPKAWSRMGEILTQDFFARSEFDLVYGYYRPLTTLSYLMDYQVWRLQPWGYHLTNLFLHALASALVVNLLLRLTWPPAAALLAGALFAVHPIHSESVAWIAGRTDLLAFVLAIAALRLHVAARPGLQRTAGPLLFGLSLLAKETAIVLLPWVVILEALHNRRRAMDVLSRLLPYLAVLILYVVWRFVIIRVGTPSAPPLHTALSILLSAPPTLLRYLGWLTLPLRQSAYVINDYVLSPADPRLWLSLPALAALGAAALVAVRRDTSGRSLVALALLAAALIPSLNLVRPSSPLNMGATMAERFCYFPSFPFVALVGLACVALKHSARRQPWLSGLVTVASVSLVVAGTWATVARNRVWADEPTFLTQTLETAPQALLLWGRLAEYHLERRDLEAAQRAIERAAAIDPEAEPVLMARAYLLVLQNRSQEALPLQETLVQRARFAVAPARNNLAYLYRINGRPDDARRLLEALIEQGHGYGDVYANLAEVYRAQGDRGRAREFYQRAMSDRPDDRQVAGALVSLEIEDGRPAIAAEIYQDLLRYYPGDRRIENNIAMIRANAGDLTGAERSLRDILARFPDYASARVNLAQVVYRQGNAAAAIAELRRAQPLVRGTELERPVADQIEAWSTTAANPAGSSSK